MTAKDLTQLYKHPFWFAVGIGVANGMLAVTRNKKIDVNVTLALAAILGIGEMAIEAFTPPSEREHSLQEIGLYSILGVGVGLAPFIVASAKMSSGGRALPIATGPTSDGGGTVV